MVPTIRRLALARGSVFSLARSAAFGFILLPIPIWAETQTLLLDVQLNGHSIGRIGEFTLRDGVLLSTRTELHELGIRGPLGLLSRVSRGQKAEPGSLIRLSDLPGLRWRIDQRNQTLYLSATDDILLPKVLEGSDRTPAQVDAQAGVVSGTGATVNYDVATTVKGKQVGLSSSFDLRAFSPVGVISSGMLVYAGSRDALTSQAYASDRAVRLDTVYTFSDVAAMRRYSLGDLITGGLGWTRPVRLTGVQFRSDFNLRPDLVTFPLPSFAGTAAVPSTVDVLANGNLVVSRPVDAGPFEIPQLPVVNGASTVSITVTNALGQQVSVTRPIYASALLLAPGLQDFSAQVGLVRREWSQVSNDYGKAAAIGDYSRGLTRSFTVQTSVEVTPGTALAGVGAVVGVSSLGVLNASLTAGSGKDGGGARFSFGAQRLGRVFSFGVSDTVSSRCFQDVAALNGGVIQRRLLSATAGLDLRRLGSLGLSYAETRQDPSPHPLVGEAVLGQHGEVVSGSYSLQFSRLAVSFSEFRDIAHAGSNGMQAGLTVPLGRRRSLELNAGSGEGYGEARIQKSATEIGQWGYDAYASGAGSAHAFAQLQHKTPFGLLTGGIDQGGAGTTLRAESQGAFSSIDHALLASNTVSESFAVVDTNGLANVHVLAENRYVGVTDAKGRLLVSDLRAFELNHLAIDANDVPLDSTLDTSTHNVKPQDLSGVVVRFPITVSHAALLRLVDDLNTPLPVSTQAVLRATHTAFPVGYDGEVYVQDLSALNQLDAELPNGRKCTAVFGYFPVKERIPTIGPLHCRMTSEDIMDFAGRTDPLPAVSSDRANVSASPISAISRQR